MSTFEKLKNITVLDKNQTEAVTGGNGQTCITVPVWGGSSWQFCY